MMDIEGSNRTGTALTTMTRDSDGWDDYIKRATRLAAERAAALGDPIA
jgi:hypothetical protein